MARRCLLYYITDRSQFRGDESARRGALLGKIAEAARAGVDYIQLREKNLCARDLEAIAVEAVRIVRDEERLANREQRIATRVLINSRTDVALAAGADGVHLRSDDIPPNEVTRIWNSRSRGGSARAPIIAASCHTRAQVMQAESEEADFTVFGPVFEKRDRPEASPVGLSALREACRSKIPVFALGGVTVGNAGSCLAAGAAGVAGIRLFQENNVEEVVRELRTL